MVGSAARASDEDKANATSNPMTAQERVHTELAPGNLDTAIAGFRDALLGRHGEFRFALGEHLETICWDPPVEQTD